MTNKEPASYCRVADQPRRRSQRGGRRKESSSNLVAQRGFYFGEPALLEWMAEEPTTLNTTILVKRNVDFHPGYLDISVRVAWAVYRPDVKAYSAFTFLPA
jgi:hypothetical protein